MNCRFESEKRLFCPFIKYISYSKPSLHTAYNILKTMDFTMMNCKQNFLDIIQYSYPDAYANIYGNDQYPCLKGMARFYGTSYGGTLVEVEVYNLPLLSDASPSSFYGMHIHENGDCTPPFDKTGDHYNPCNTSHPMHAGDMPALLGNNGYAYSVFYTERYQPDNIIGRSIIIHSHADDYMTQPSGNSGEKIGCGIIKRYCR